METIGARLTNTGVLYTAGEFDEVTQNTISITADTVYAREFDETALIARPMRYMIATNVIQVKSELDEVTGIINGMTLPDILGTDLMDGSASVDLQTETYPDWDLMD